ncbi:3'(2'),5'-bisphosphate nucleotidase CysQ [Rhizobium sp. F40D2]|uniref:3'(2'),5'-bisphosphate nucleotidase CysQ n=1 Tax=Rhizobium sp. F40D2 TaxID=3453141 RepID=UPI003F1F8EA8
MRDLLDDLEDLALLAGKVIMSVYAGEIESRSKADASPVTEADARAEAIILDGLRTRYPLIPIVAEEECSCGRLPSELGNRFFLVDPLDGTTEFINRRGEFTVNIALVENGIPSAGVVYAPALGKLYLGSGRIAQKRMIDASGRRGDSSPVKVRGKCEELTAVASRSHSDPTTETWLGRMGVRATVSVGSSLKFCLVAEGEADVYPRLGRTMEWDTAAGHAVLLGAGGSVTCLNGKALTYGKRNQAVDADFANPHFVASSKPRRDRM